MPAWRTWSRTAVKRSNCPLCIALVRLVGHRKVGQDAFNFKVGQQERLLEKGQDLVRQQPQASHTGIDLDVDAGRAADLAGGPAKGARRVQVKDGGRDVVQEGVAGLPGRRIAKDQDWRFDLGLSKQNAFAETGHAQRLGAIVDCRARDANRAMSVAVGLEHDHQGDLRADDAADLAQIAGDRAQVYLEPGRALGQRELHVAKGRLLAHQQIAGGCGIVHQAARDLFHSFLARALDQHHVIRRAAAAPGGALPPCWCR